MMARAITVLTDDEWQTIEERWPQIYHWLEVRGIEVETVREITVQSGFDGADYSYYMQIKTYRGVEPNGWVESVHHISLRPDDL